MGYDFDKIQNRYGTYCTQWDFIQDRFGKSGILPFSISDTDFLPPEEVLNVVTEVAARGQFGYTRWNHHDFKGSIASWFERRYNASVDEDWILYSPSVMYSVSLLIRLLTDPGDGVLCFDPMYDSFPGVVEGNDRTLVRSILLPNLENASVDCLHKTFEIDFEQLDKLAASCKAMLLCSPHNPTGRMWTEEELNRIIDICRSHNLWIISDEIHADISLCGRSNISLISKLKEYERVVVATSPTKTFNTPGLIGSYVVLPSSKVREAFLNITRHVDFLNSCSTLGLYATMVAYNKCEVYVDDLCSYIRGNMQVIKSFLSDHYPNIKFEIPEATYLAWIDVSSLEVSSKQLQDALVNIGNVGIMPGETYGNSGAGYLRMCVGCPREKLNDGLRRFAKGIDSLSL